MEESFPVKVHIYDLTKGMAKMFSQMYLGKHLEGVWHTGIVVYGKEYFFGSMGIENCIPGTTVIGPPDTVVDLGTTCLPFEIFSDWLNGMAMTTFRGSKYNLFDHNCNTFSSELAQFLTGKRLPSYVTDLSADILSTPLGQQIRTMMDSIAASATPVGPDPSRSFASSRARDPVFDAEEEALMAAAQAAVAAPMPRATARMRDTDDSGSDADDVFPATSASSETKKPITFAEVDVTEVYAALQRGLQGIIPAEDTEILDEIFEFITAADDSGSVSKSHFTFLSDILISEELAAIMKIHTLKLLQNLVRASNAVNVLRFCPEHPVVEYLLLLGKQRSPDSNELLEAIKMLCNACSTTSGFSWLTDATDWSPEEDKAIKTSNVQTAAQFCAWCLLKQTKEVQDAAVKLAYNLSIPEIPDQPLEIICDALLRLLSQPNTWTESVAGNAVAALMNFVDLNSAVADRIRRSGVDWEALQGKYPKLRESIAALSQKVR